MRKGFTLIEILTVLAIIGILVSLGGYTYSSALTRSRDGQRISDLKVIGNSLEQFYLDNRAYPIFDNSRSLPQASWQLEGNYNCQTDPNRKYLAPKYLNKIPQDPTYKFSDASCTADAYGQYLYFGLHRLDSKIGYYLVARMERAQNANYKSEVSATLVGTEGYNLGSLSFCTQVDFTPENAPNCSHNYYVTNSKNN